MLLEDVVVGSILLEPIYYNGVLLVRRGTQLSATLINSLQKFGIQTVEATKKVSKIDTSSRLTLDYVYSYVDNLIASIESQESLTMHLLFDYDVTTYQHSHNVAVLAAHYGYRNRFSAPDVRTLALGGLLHDIGKLSIPLDILQKPTRLTKEDFDIMQTHPQLGYDMLQGSNVPTAVKQIVLQHHENFDGSGYPRHLHGTRIYRLARIIHCCDVYEALCAKRPYKNRMLRTKAMDIILQDSYKAFDPNVAKDFYNTMPVYLVGDIIETDTVQGFVVDAGDSRNPIIFCDGKLFALNTFADKYAIA